MTPLTDEQIDRVLDRWHDTYRAAAWSKPTCPSLKRLYETALVDLARVAPVLLRAMRERVPWGLDVLLVMLREAGVTYTVPRDIRGRLALLQDFTTTLVEAQGFRLLPLRSREALLHRACVWVEDVGGTDEDQSWRHPAFAILLDTVDRHWSVEATREAVRDLERTTDGSFPGVHRRLDELHAALERSRQEDGREPSAAPGATRG